MRTSIYQSMFAMAVAALLPCFAAAAHAAPGPFSVAISSDPASVSVEPGRPVTWTVSVNNEGDALAGAKLAWRLAAWDGTAVEDSVGINLRKGDNAASFRAQPPLLGWYQLTVDIVGRDGGVLVSGNHAFVVAEPYRGKAGAFRYGLCTHVLRHQGDRYRSEMEAMSQIGIDWARTDILWGHVEAEDNEWNFRRMDLLAEDFRKANIEPQAVLAYTTRWGSTGPTDTGNWLEYARAMPKLDAWLEYVETTVKRYPQITLWEVWNEPDIGHFWLGTTDEYVTLFNETSRLIKKIKPDAVVMNGGLAMVSRVPNPNFMQEFPVKADKTHWDMWAYHDYHTFEAQLTRFAATHEMMRSTGKDLPIWMNEGGFNALQNGGVDQQATTLVKKLSTAPYLGMKGYAWYVMVDPSNDPNDRENHFGLLRYNHQPRPQFATYQRLIRELGPRTYVQPSESGELPSQLWAHLYQANDADGEHVIVLWRQIAGMKTPMRLSWGDEQHKVTSVIDVMGNPVKFSQSSDGGAMLDVGYEPVYVRFTGPAAHPQIAPVLDAPATITLTPADQSKFKLVLHNPAPQAVTYELAVIADDPGVSASVSPGRVELPPRQSSDITLAVNPGKGLERLTGELRLTLSEPGASEPVSASLPYEMSQVIPRRGSSLSIDLVTRENMVNMYSAEPVRTMHWKGVEDLSATSKFSYDNENLYVQIIATDDTHFPIDGEKLWEGDSVQLCVWVGDDARKFLELSVGMDQHGRAQAWVGRRADRSLWQVGQVSDAASYITVERKGNQTGYQLALPWRAFGVDSPPATLRLNYLVNDNDSLGRKGWMQITDGIGSGKNPNLFRIFVLR